ncbi:hypothetical protein J3L16_08275 [Alteromonas sp. 5E99-2]|uniref:hypothetical protein n=1 Tax=Alteromonas sp. 5E99-2 TaxID=2817683 RepID=UPI001A98DA1C|nr:hypothetical protein [Alteromonas sp. 5E99-2]MBO1255677.1 hypothetical protein [Alteromonas sp. 5E99-2]
METLHRQIRYAENVENPKLFTQLLNCGEGNVCCHQQQWHFFLNQFHLLLDTLTDESLPPHWRQQCLDHIYKPLFKLRQLARNDQQNYEINQLYYELRVMSDYVKAGLAT